MPVLLHYTRMLCFSQKTGPRYISFRCKITVSLVQRAVHDAEADVADPVFVRSTITCVGGGMAERLGRRRY